MSLFVDTSAFYAYMVGSDEAHPAVSREFTAALTGRSRQSGFRGGGLSRVA